MTALLASSGLKAATRLRVACLEWTAAETAIGLGLAPIALADLRGYRDWAVSPPPPERAVDVGSRFEPNLEVLRELRPNLILISRGYGLSETSLSGIAPVYELAPIPETGTALDNARRETRRLAERLGLGDRADVLIEQTDKAFRNARETLKIRPQPPVCILSLFEDRHVRVYARGGLVQDVLDALGVENAWEDGGNRWGFASVGLERLATLPRDVLLITLDPIPPHIRSRLARSSLWNDLPAVRAGHVASIAPVWPFGGLAAAARLAGLLSARLAP